MSDEASSAEPAPRFRYVTVPPATVRLTVDDLTFLLPAGMWVGSEADKQREIALPTAEILTGNFPRLRLARLRDLLPGCLAPVEGAPEWIALPADRVALAYRPETRREEILPSAPPVETDSDSIPAEPLVPGWKKLPKPTLAPPPLPPAEEVAPVPPPLPPPVALADLRPSLEAEARLQQIFMTEETLPLGRVVELAGELPSLQGCALSRGVESLRSQKFPAGLDLPALTGASFDLLQKAGANSGLKLQPAVTLYAESGPISLLHRGDLRLLVVHRERGFLPGVREKLEAVLEAFATAQ